MRYYIKHGSEFYVSFLDASKAFDRLNHNKLVKKMLNYGVPLYVVRIICYWYASQSYCIKWGTDLSEPFFISNGVRQGGILSPYLFNLYLNDLSVQLNKIQIGCCCNGRIVNHLMYADDLVVFAPSAKRLQTLLNTCSNYGKSHDEIQKKNDKQKMTRNFGKMLKIN